MRTQLVHRADRLTGPYQGRVALRDQGVAQGGLIDTPQGEWYAFLFQDHGAVGRTPYLVPVRWEDGWPVHGVDGKAPVSLRLRAGEGGIRGLVASDEFRRKRGERALPLAWQWNHNPDDRCWDLGRRPGMLRLTTGRVDADLTQARNTLTQRTFGPDSTATTAVDTSGMHDGDFAGLTAFQKRYGFVGVTMQGGAKSIVMVSAASGQPEELGRVPLTQKTAYLRIDCDFKERADQASFSYSLDGKRWTAIGPPLRMRYDIPHFMGYRFGLFNYATRTPGGFADFDYFRIGDSRRLAAPLRPAGSQR
jgi:beta-xylosidase